MKEYTLAQQYALIGLDGVDSKHWDMVKAATVRGIAAAKLLEEILKDEESVDLHTFQRELVIGTARIRHQKRGRGKKIGKEMADLLIADGTLEEVPDLISCDIDYNSGNCEIKAYRTEPKTYQEITEWLRAEVLEDGPMTQECISLLWLLRESGCLYELFTVAEQKKLEERMVTLVTERELYSILWRSEFHSNWESMVRKFKQSKKQFFKEHPAWQGVNLVFPFMERRSGIFIDDVILGTTVEGRRLAMVNYLTEQGHYVDMVKSGEETLLKIDNAYYRIFPTGRSIQGIPIQGAYLVPVYR